MWNFTERRDPLAVDLSRISTCVQKNMERGATSKRRNNSDRSRSPFRSSKKSYEKTLVSLEQAAVSKIEETNLFDQFPEVQTEVQIKENATEISFCGPPYKKKQLIMEMFFELQKNNIFIPR